MDKLKKFYNDHQKEALSLCLTAATVGVVYGMKTAINAAQNNVNVLDAVIARTDDNEPYLLVTLTNGRDAFFDIKKQ